jgi:hypothetical protein
MFCVPSITRQLFAICHIIEKTTPREYDLFCVSQTCHTKEGEQGPASVDGKLISLGFTNFLVKVELMGVQDPGSSP